MSNNICGNCQNFNLKSGDKFFNCTSAKHAGVKYGMQVRADTRSCEAFLTFGTPSTTKTPTPPKPTLEPKLKLEPKPNQLLRSRPALQPQSELVATPQTKTIAEPKPESKPKAGRKPPQELSTEDQPRPTGLCVWGRVILVTALVLVIGLPAWGIYSCASKTTSAPVATPAPMPANAVVKDFAVGENELVTGPDRAVIVSSTEKTSSYTDSTGTTFEAPSGKVFVFITVTCSNTDDTTLLTGPAYFVLTDSTGLSYQDQTYSVYHFSKPYPNASLSPHVKVNGRILWTVPVSASALEVSYLLDSESNPPVIARWTLP